MSPELAMELPITVQVSNVGGITESSIEFTSDTTILTGRNASNRTSMLQAIMAACGSDQVTLKGDAEQGAVELTIGEETYTRTLERRNGTVAYGGDPMLEDPELADRFAFLIEANDARRAITRGEDLRAVLMEPIDTNAIEAEIDRLQTERDDLREELDELEALNRKLPDLEHRKQDLENRIATKGDALEAKAAELAAADSDLDETRDDQSELEEKLDELKTVRSTLEDVRFRIETEEQSIDSLRDELSEVESDLAEYPEAPEGEIQTIDEELDRLRSRRSRLNEELSKLQSVIDFNRTMVNGTESADIISALRDEPTDENVTDQLVDEEGVICWTCGTAVARADVEGTLDSLRDLHKEKADEVAALGDEIDDLSTELKELHQHRERRTSLEQRIERIEAEIDDREEQLSSLTDRRDDLQADIESLETTVDELESDVYDEILDLHRETNQLEFELRSLESEHDDVKDEIRSIEDRLAERETLEARLDEVTTEITELRTKIERLEKQAVEQFNEHMAEVLDRLEYANITRVWIERVEREVSRGNRTVVEGRFDLHVVRETANGTTYEDTIDHLSESEREVVGLVFALAGYLVHEVYEDCPFMILDSLEALDSSRIAILIDYLRDYAEYLVVALLPEDADALDESFQRITEI